jgi:hypothetical protein
MRYRKKPQPLRLTSHYNSFLSHAIYYTNLGLQSVLPGFVFLIFVLYLRSGWSFNNTWMGLFFFFFSPSIGVHGPYIKDYTI